MLLLLPPLQLRDAAALSPFHAAVMPRAMLFMILLRIRHFFTLFHSHAIMLY